MLGAGRSSAVPQDEWRPLSFKLQDAVWKPATMHTGNPVIKRLRQGHQFKASLNYLRPSLQKQYFKIRC